MYKKGHDFDYQFDWVVKKAGGKVNQGDYADAKPEVGKLTAAADPPTKQAEKKNQFIEERKESRAALGQQVMNGGIGSAPRPNQNGAR